MPLTRDTVTAASRIMLPTYPVFFGLTGINYVVNADRLADSPGLRFLDSVIPMPGWGLLFLAAATLMVYALLQHRRVVYRYALWLCLVASALFAGGLAFAVIFGGASFSAPLWPAFVATCCWATERSLATRET